MNRARVLWGLALLTVGALWLLDAAGLVHAGPLIGGWWPLALVVYGLAQFLDRPPHVSSAVLAVAAGLALLALTTGLVDAAVLAVLWPVALVGSGLWLMLGRRGRRSVRDEDAVSGIALFSGKELASRAARFRGGSLAAAFGGMQLDLRGASLDPEGALLDLTATFAGIDVVVPAGWRVRLRGPVLFGGAVDRTGPAGAPSNGPVLDVRVFVIFGGVEVKSDTRRMATP